MLSFAIPNFSKGKNPDGLCWLKSMGVLAIFFFFLAATDYDNEAVTMEETTEC